MEGYLIQTHTLASNSFKAKVPVPQATLVPMGANKLGLVTPQKLIIWNIKKSK
jgi:hypothetical protein